MARPTTPATPATPATSATPDPLVRDVLEVVGPAGVLSDPDTVAGYCTDWTGRFHGQARMVVRPGSTEEVAGVVRACRAHGAALVPQGGNTGLVGGGVPLGGEVVLSLSRLGDVGDVDGAAAQVTAGAGATVAAVERAAAAAGLAYAVDLASRDSATVGGTIATNAAGLRALRSGDTRAQVIGVEAVLGDGSVVSHLSGLVRDNTGYHLPSLLCGSEGTLAVVTRARLRLVAPLAPDRTTALVGFASVADAVDGVAALRRAVVLDACELMLTEGIDLVRAVTGAPSPFPAEAGGPRRAVLLVEAGGGAGGGASGGAGGAEGGDVLAEAVASLAGVTGAAVATGGARRAALWELRERHTEAVNNLGPPHKLDVALPFSRLAQFVEEIPGVVTAIAPGARTWIFGHAADGNVHVNVTGLAPDDERVDDAVLHLVADLGGSISAEHGIGTAKRRWLALSRSPAEIAAMRAIKRALDPDGILNPGVLFP